MNACRERELWGKFNILLGIDEAGRGPWAGPLSAAAVVFPSRFVGMPAEFINLLNDSKQLSEKNREMLFSEIKKYSLAYSISYFDNKFIDEQGIGVANKMIVEKLYKNIKRKIKNIDLVLLDYIGAFRTKNFKYKMEAKGDSLYLSIAAASVLAKVGRDRLMKKYDKQWPEYAFAQHKGYGTKAHREAIEKHGVCEIHRMSFAPMKNMGEEEVEEQQLDLGF